jgi:hypothetical protein
MLFVVTFFVTNASAASQTHECLKLVDLILGGQQLTPQYRLAMDRFKRAGRFGKLTLLQEEFNEIDAVLSQAENFGHNPNALFETLYGLASKKNADLPSILTMSKNMQVFLNITNQESAPEVLEIVSRLKAIDKDLNVAQTLNDFFKLLNAKSTNYKTLPKASQEKFLKGVFGTFVAELAQKRPALGKLAPREKAGAFVDDVFLAGWIKWLRVTKPSAVPIDLKIPRSAAMNHVWDGLVNLSRLGAAVTGSLPTELLQLGLTRYANRSLTFTGVLLTLPVDIYLGMKIFEYLHSKTPSGRIEKAATELVELSVSYDVETFYTFHEQFEGGTDEDERFNPSFDPELMAVPAAQRTQQQTIAAVKRLQAQFVDYLRARSQSPKKLNADQLMALKPVAQLVDVFDRSRLLPSSTRASLAALSDDFLLSMHQLDLGLVKLYNTQRKSNEVVSFPFPMSSFVFNDKILGDAYQRLFKLYQNQTLDEIGFRMHLQSLLYNSYRIQCQAVIQKDQGLATIGQTELELKIKGSLDEYVRSAESATSNDLKDTYDPLFGTGHK